VLNSVFAGPHITFATNSWTAGAHAYIILRGSDEQGLNSSIAAVKQLNGIISKAGISASYEMLFPDLIEDVYTSNHFIWNNSFDQIKRTTLTLQGELFKRINIELRSESFKDYIYFDQEGIPKQLATRLNVNSVSAVTTLHFMRYLNLYANLRLADSDHTLYRIPRFYSYSALYAEKTVFRNALKASAGIGCLYFSAFKANAVMPATMISYLQNEKIGDYPYLELFIAFRIRSVNFFIKGEHLNAGITEKSYLYLPHQPTPGRTLKAGIQWNFSEIQLSKREQSSTSLVE
jgi:hypothetical protein